MNRKYLISTTLVSLGVTLLLSFPLKVSSQESQTATPGADLDTIKENVIKRIQEVVSDKSTTNSPSLTAYYGILDSVSANTLSIASLNGGVNLASTSASTSYVRLPGSTSIDFEDLVIDEYIVAIGFLDEVNVLDTLRVITQKSPPPPPTLQLTAGIVDVYDQDEYELTLLDHEGQEQLFLVGRSSDIYIIDTDGTKTAINRTQEIPPDSHILAVYEAVDEGDTPIPSELIIKPPFPYVTPAEISQ